MIGKTIRSLRTTNNMTQKELANKLSISPSTIGMYEQGRREPDLNTISKIANIFNAPVDYLLGRSNERTQSVHKTPDSDSKLEVPTIPTQSLSERERDIIENFRLLNKDNQDIIVGELKKCLKEQRHEESVAADEPLKRTGTSLGK